MSERITLSLPAKPQYAALARLAALEVAGRSGLDHEAADDVRLATSEAFTSAIRHAADAGDIQVELFPGDGEVAVEVRWSAGAGPAEAGATDEDLDEDELGLMMIRDLADDVGTQDQPEGSSLIRFVRRG